MVNAFQWENYREVLVFLTTAGVAAPLFHKLRISPVLGFLFAGALLGPHGLGQFAAPQSFLSYVTLADVEGVAHIAEFGLVFLLFMIGLELSFERLVRMRRLVFGLGLSQVVATTLALSCVGVFWFKLAPGPAVLMGAALAMSSTAIVIPVLAESRRLAKPSGRAAFAVLLLQDLMVAPLLFLVSALSSASGVATSGVDVVWSFLPAFIALGALIAGGRLLLRPFFHLVAAAQSTELFMAACLLVVIGSAVVSAVSGMSMGLGAFIAGLLLAETEFRREIEVTIEPFKGLLLGLFFVSIGAELDIGALLADPAPALLHACGLIAVKAVVIFALARLFGLDVSPAREAALLLAPGGEFAFVLLASAISAGVLPDRHGGDAMVVATLTVFAIPGLGWLGAFFARSAEKAPETAAGAQFAPDIEIAQGRVVIVGYGRVGALVGDMLRRHDIPFVAVDNDVAAVAAGRAAGVEAYWGDSSRKEFLMRCGVAQARALVVTVHAPRAAEEIVRVAKEERADLLVVARARDADHATRLYELGASDAIPETIEASMQLAETVLVDIGVPMGFVIASIHEKRDEYRKLLQPSGEEARRRKAERLGARQRELARRRGARNDITGDDEP
jgi:monovalent cation:H+ antiporter-2, CPA2 family